MERHLRPRPPGDQMGQLVHKRLGETQCLLYLLVRDKAHHFVDEAMAFAPHLVKEGKLTLVFRAKSLLAEQDNGQVLTCLAGAKTLVQYESSRCLKQGIINDIECPIRVIRQDPASRR